MSEHLLRRLVEWRQSMPADWYGNPAIDDSIKEINDLRATVAGLKGEPVPARIELANHSTFGFCPHCSSRSVSREKRPDGNDRCEKGHVYPSSSSVHFLQD